MATVVEIIAKLKDEVSKEMKEVTNSLKGFNETLLGITRSAAIVAGSLAVVKKAMDFGREGAVIVQTGESFEFLLKKIGAAPDLLEQMERASKGTVDELTLMAGVSTLVAGTSDELARALADASPQLMEIAKAANKLNPSLGDTAFMFQSIALGIKRASPMILDNLGITIKMGEAYEKFAQSIGKSADELTKEEQQMAILNAVLESGGRLIDQVGGKTDAATDSFDRFNVSVGKVANEVKKSLVPFLTDAADAVYLMMSWTDQLTGALQTHAREVLKSSKSYEEYEAEMRRAAQAAGYMVDAEGNLIRIRREGGGVTKEVVKANYLYSEAVYEAMRAVEEMSEADKAAAKWMAEYGAATEEASVSTEELKVAAEGLAAGLKGELKEAMEEYNETIADLDSQEAEITAEMQKMLAEGVSPLSEEYQELVARLGEVRDKELEAAEALQEATAQMIYQIAAADLDTMSALQLANTMGLLSQQDYVVAASLQALREQFDKNADGAIDAAEAASGYTDAVTLLWQAVSYLQEQGIEITFENLAAAMQKLADSGTSVDNLAQGLEGVSQAIDPDTPEEIKAIGEAAPEIDDTTEAAEGAIEPLESLAENAELLGDKAEDTVPKVGDLIAQIKNLTDTINKVPTAIVTKFSQHGASEVIAWVNKLKDAVNNLPKSVTMTINVSTASYGVSGGGSQGTTPPQSLASMTPQTTQTPSLAYAGQTVAAGFEVQSSGAVSGSAPTVNVTVNAVVSDQMSAELLANKIGRVLSKVL